MANNSNTHLDVCLFENRHIWPASVTDYIYAEKPGGYDPRDFEVFEGLAMLKFLSWKAKGIQTINLYLSGLVGATIAALNAAYSVGIYVKLFHYSTSIDKWIPQLCDFLPVPPGIILTEDEILTLEEEEKVKKEMLESERHILVSYVTLFNTLYNNYNPDRFSWEDVRSYIMREYKNIVPEYVELMKPFFDNTKQESEKSYGEQLRTKLEGDRGKRKALPIYKPSDSRKSRNRKHRIYGK